MSERLAGVFAALLATLRVPLKVPAALGEKVTLIVVLCPAATVSGSAGAVSEKYWVEIAALLTVTELGPEFVAVTVRVLLLPAATLPKLRVVAERERVVLCTWTEEPTLTPWQPARKMRPATRSNAPASFPRCFEEIAFAGVLSIVSHGTVAPSSTNSTTVCTGGDGSSSI